MKLARFLESLFFIACGLQCSSAAKPFALRARTGWLDVRGGASAVNEPTTMMGFNGALAGAGPDTLVVIDFSGQT